MIHMEIRNFGQNEWNDIVSDIDRSQDLLNSSNQLHNDQYKDLLNYMEKCRKK